MATYTVTGNCVQGLPNIGTNSKSADPRSDVAVTITQAGGIYYYKGASVDQTLISASQPVIDSMVAKGVLT